VHAAAAAAADVAACWEEARADAATCCCCLLALQAVLSNEELQCEFCLCSNTVAVVLNVCDNGCASICGSCA
jgi:hypothetical protein